MFLDKMEKIEDFSENPMVEKKLFVFNLEQKINMLENIDFCVCYSTKNLSLCLKFL